VLALHVAPLCPAGHLPRKGGDPAFIYADTKRQRGGVRSDKAVGLISPLVGEMSGRTEGGAKGFKPR